MDPMVSDAFSLLEKDSYTILKVIIKYYLSMDWYLNPIAYLGCSIIFMDNLILANILHDQTGRGDLNNNLPTNFNYQIIGFNPIVT